MENFNNKRVTKEQKFMLVQYLEDHKEFAHDRFVNDAGVQSLKEQWNHLANKLNACGGAVKDGEGWKRAWVNMRSKSKQKSQDIKNAMERSGINSSRLQKNLTDLDERIIGIMSTVAVVGQVEVGEPLRSSGAVASVELFDKIGDNADVEFLEENQEFEESPLGIPVASTSSRQRRAPRRKNVSIEDLNSQILQLEEKRFRLTERKIAALEQRNRIEDRKATALEKANEIKQAKVEVLSNILNTLESILKT